ncbi:MAG: DNA (cytosine-5-)-methyltransferase [Phenylobacterium sp.]|uniref:DNA cytosine methyltransferase n=1 Tax=Phenylobacterium sp. TaxID=1871053 RepID=UPI002720D878|nr:DNA (cytosine-5-)-methyltransferase [Phenylobacterium sp.]MDO8900526.1 DNA (cytosine-5-)-methyltransferase [Phenylobacterium sp.]
MTDPSIARKLERLSDGNPVRVLDLFAGCGGISLGFQRAGFQIEAAIEFDPLAALSHATNFHRHAAPAEFERHASARDITAIEPEQLVAELGLEAAPDAFDVLVGGPPCQAYARVGRAKLRDVAQHPEAFKVDARGNLYLRYLHYVNETKPLALLMENVPDIMNYGGHNVVAEIAEALSDMGYIARYTLLNASRFGVPQMRDRVILLAFHESLGITPSFPAPTRHVDLPPGYSGTRAVAFKNIDMLCAGTFIEEPVGPPSLPYAVTAEEAIGDLPPITLHLEGKLKRGARRFDVVTRYDSTRLPSSFAADLRNWSNFESTEGISDHVIRYLPRDTFIFREMPNGAEYPAAHATAVRLFEEAVADLKAAGHPVSQESRDALFRKMVPPYPVTNFPNRWWKLRRDQPSRTLLAHIGKDTYSHIHYDSDQARTISVREAARLQSFPDGFVFRGTMNPAFRQIGNAVPPLLAFALAKHIKAMLSEAVSARDLVAA